MNFIFEEYAFLFEALGVSIVHSLWQAALIWITIVGFVKVFKIENPASRYQFLFLGQVVLLACFFYTFFSIYQSSFHQEISIASMSGMDEGSKSNQIAHYSTDIKSWSYFITISKIWMVGLILFFGKMVIATINYYLTRRDTAPVQNEQLLKLFNQLKDKIQISSSIDLKLSNRNIGPAVLGVLKPIVLLPISIVNQLSMEEVEYILIHELAHIKRNDHLTLLIQRLTETLLYFNPFVWFMSREMNKSREQACDDMVLSLTSDNKVEYTKSLVRLHELIDLSNNTFQLAAVKKKSDLWYRVKRILTSQTKNDMNMKKAIVFLLVPVFFVLVSFGNKEPKFPENSTNENLGETHVFPEATDTIPVNKRKIIRQEINNGVEEEVIMEYENDELISLKVNGKEVDRENFSEYQKELNESKFPQVQTYRLKEDKINELKKHLKIKQNEDGDDHVIILGDEENESLVIRRNKDGKKVFPKSKSGQAENFRIKIDPDNGFISLNGTGLNISADNIKMNKDEILELFGDVKMNLDANGEDENVHIEMFRSVDDEIIIDMDVEDIENEIEEVLEGLDNLGDLDINIPGTMELHKNGNNIFISMDTEEVVEQSHSADYPNRNLQHIIAKELKRDYLIDDTDTFSFKLKKGRLKVNGRKVSKPLTKKYIDIIEKHKATKLTDDFSIEIKRN